jgi:preprotein translocase subunit YajC
MNLAHAAELAFAQTQSTSPASSPLIQQLISILPFVGVFFIFYFLMIRPQQRQRRERERMLSAVKKGDRIVTSSGMHGTVTGLSDQTVVLRVADGVKLEFDRSAIGRIIERQTGADKDA